MFCLYSLADNAVISETVAIVHDYEKKLRKFAKDLAQIESKKHEKQRYIESMSSVIKKILVLLHLEKHSPIVNIFSCKNTDELVQVSIIFNKSITKIKDIIDEIKEAVSQNKELQQVIAEYQSILNKTNAALSKERAYLEYLMKKNTDRKVYKTFQELIDAITREVDSWYDLFTSLEAQAFLDNISFKCINDISILKEPVSSDAVIEDDHVTKRYILNANDIISSPQDGIIFVVANFCNAKNIVIIQHNIAFFSVLINVSNINIQSGSVIKAGEKIGHASTNGEQIFFKIYKNDNFIKMTTNNL